MTNRRPLLRERHAHEHARVTYVELFFDLVFVFAVTQLSHGLIAHPTGLGVLHTGLLLLAVWWAWVYTAWVTNWMDPERTPVRIMLFVMMAAALVLAAAIPDAFEGRGLVFACAYVFIQVGRTLFFLVGVWREPAHRVNFVRILSWFVVSAVLWIAGAFQQGEARLLVWAVAMAIEYAAPAMGYWTPGIGRSNATDWSVEGAHLAERCALFTIIALGESIIVAGATVVGLPWSAEVIAAFASAVVCSIAMWWIYFSATAEAASEAIAHSANPGAIARVAYTYSHLLPVAGIIVTAVGDEWVIHHPLGHADFKTAAAVIGGPALFLFGSLVFKLAVFRRWSPTRISGLALLAVLALAAGYLSPLVLSVLTTLVLVLVGGWETALSARQKAPA
ncbi:low temperature requirement protein A [Caulobacter segnis]|jgi:low temperature requirement protein LtrA|uniref:low temperature requirement protein A n=1 Tax=Caulobacter segnis TaxID=88688 RepID=UPI001CBD6AEF|nr:low temperature requirement protein A [Caulobacter segnis]UAL12181.1 low temperature requirement protein A [Caulobacter segnis]